MFQEIEKCISVFADPKRYYLCKLLKTAAKVLTNNNNEVNTMNWKKTTINLKMGNDEYPKGYKIIPFSNIVENPSKEQVETLAEGLTLLSGDKFLGSEIIRHDTLNAD